MKATLAEQHRPVSFEEFSGSELAVSMLTKMVENKTIPSCLLFSGSKGIGKTSMCRIISTELNGGSSTPMSYIEVDAASNSGVDNIRALQETVRYTHPGTWRVVVLDECHSLSSAAFNALLKILEDPPPMTVFILVTTKPESIPDTVRSRAMTFRFQPLDRTAIAKRLAQVIHKDSLPITDASVVWRIADVSDGSLRTALILLQQVLLLDSVTVDAVNSLSGNIYDTRDLMYAMLSGELSAVETEVSTAFGLSCDVERLLLSLIKSLKEFHDTDMVSNSQFLSCMSVVWGMRHLNRSNDMVSRTQLEAGVFAMFSQNFWNGKDSTQAKEVKVIEPGGLAEALS